jgi:hypothetical protein
MPENKSWSLKKNMVAEGSPYGQTLGKRNWQIH